MSVRWVGEKQVRRNIGEYGNDAKAAIREGLEFFEPQIEADAKEKAPWQDQTTAARSGLFTWVETGDGVGRLYLSHRMFYGIFLERKHAGRYAIVMPTLQAFEGRVMAFFRRVFSG